MKSLRESSEGWGRWLLLEAVATSQEALASWHMVYGIRQCCLSDCGPLGYRGALLCSSFPVPTTASHECQDMIVRGPWQDGWLLRLLSPFLLLPEDPRSLLLVQIGRLHHGTPKKPPRSTLLGSQAPAFSRLSLPWHSMAGLCFPSFTTCFRRC